MFTVPAAPVRAHTEAQNWGARRSAFASLAPRKCASQVQWSQLVYCHEHGSVTGGPEEAEMADNC